ncbi:hypothetical protein, partial [Microbacterium sp. WCS2018Hpa-9]|uniref:hypothetical protein n=1 Tax=Microbacterium sp. WCS2018Hpa-9 TaxID=3073635 RepID=UPI00288913A4
MSGDQSAVEELERDSGPRNGRGALWESRLILPAAGVFFSGGFAAGVLFTGVFFSGGFAAGVLFTGAFFSGGFAAGVLFTGVFFSGGFAAGVLFTG